LQLLLAQ